MPNGGPDCCGTCWFNQKNQGERGYDHAGDAGEDYCLVRHTRIKNPLWTYCTNHPDRNPDKIDLPIGPVFVCTGFPYKREIWQPSPDAEEIRARLPILLASVEEQPKDEDLAGVSFDSMVVWQLGEFREKRAVAGLERITRFKPPKNPGPFFRARKELVRMAGEALAKIQ